MTSAHSSSPSKASAVRLVTAWFAASDELRRAALLARVTRLPLEAINRPDSQGTTALMIAAGQSGARAAIRMVWWRRCWRAAPIRTRWARTAPR